MKYKYSAFLNLITFFFFQYSSCEIACTFYRTYGVEENQYDPTKLPAPEKDEIIRMNKHDMAITMRKNLLGIWEMDKHYTANQKVVMKPGDWIIITNENGAIKHYRYNIILFIVSFLSQMTSSKNIKSPAHRNKFHN